MKSKLTKEQIKELTDIAATANVGDVVNLSCFGKEGATNTRANRLEKILPDVSSLVVLGEDGKFSPLTEDERVDMIMKIFNRFWLKHLNYNSDHFEFIGGLQDDFFTNESYFRLLDYADVFFKNRLDEKVVERNHLKYKFETANEIKRMEQMKNDFKTSLYKKMKQVSSNFLKRKKEQGGSEVSLLQQLVANNLAWQDAQTIREDGTAREVNLAL